MAGRDVKKLFGERMRQLRRQRGVSQERFAHLIGLDRSYVGSVERGERNISLENICLIADGLQVAPAELLRFDRLPAAADAEGIIPQGTGTRDRGSSASADRPGPAATKPPHTAKPTHPPRAK